MPWCRAGGEAAHARPLAAPSPAGEHHQSITGGFCRLPFVTGPAFITLRELGAWERGAEEEELAGRMEAGGGSEMEVRRGSGRLI